MFCTEFQALLYEVMKRMKYFSTVDVKQLICQFSFGFISHKSEDFRQNNVRKVFDILPMIFFHTLWAPFYHMLSQAKKLQEINSRMFPSKQSTTWIQYFHK